MNIQKYVKDYIAYLETRNKSEGTTRIYARSVRDLLKSADKTPDKLIIKDIEKYAKWCVNRYDGNSLVPIYSAIKSYLKYLKTHCNNDIKVDEDLLKSPTFKWKPKTILTKEDILHLFEVSKPHPRDHALLKTLFYTCQRKGSIATLNLDDINYEEQTVTIRAKGGYTYKVDLHPDAIKSIRAYLKVREEPKQGHEEALFLNGYGQRMTSQAYLGIVKRYATRIGLNKRIYPHLFRSSGITIMHESGMSIADIKAQSGHKDIGSLVNTYIRPSREHVKKEVRRALNLDTKPEPQQPETKSESEPERKKPIPHNDRTDTYIALLEDKIRKLTGEDKKPEMLGYG